MFCRKIRVKYLFLITDGQSVGTLDADKRMQEAVMAARQKGISVIAIGMPTGITKVFSLCMPYEGLRRTIAKFLAAYSNIAGAEL